MDPLAALGVVVQVLTALAIIFAAWQLLFHSRAMHREFELLYVQRYWELMDRRTAKFAIGDGTHHSDRLVIRAYFQLCEDEADLRRIGRVTDNTWTFWRGAMVSQASTAAYRHELDRLDASAYPQLRAILADPEGRRKGPLAWGWLRRKLHGL
ncbi:MAG: hypothetical protein KF727_12200 [Microbacteriaceae bacterium]|nr:hypothetical protein [Microbacteriaceae bacterium]